MVEPFFLNMTQRIGPFSWIRRKEFNPVSWIWRKELNPFLEYDAKNWTSFRIWLKELNYVSNMTRRIEPFFPKRENESQNWTFLLLTMNTTHRIELFCIWLKELIFFFCILLTEWTFLNTIQRIEPLFLNATQRIELFVEYDSKNWTCFWDDSMNWTFF